MTMVNNFDSNEVYMYYVCTSVFENLAACLQKMCKNHYPKYYPPTTYIMCIEKMHFLGDLNQSEKLHEIKQGPL